MLKKCSTVLSIVLLLVVTLSAAAQTPTPAIPQNKADTASDAVGSPINDPEAWTRLLDSAEQAIGRQGVTDSDLDRLFDEAGKIRDAASARSNELTPQVAQAKRQLDELGPSPAEGDPPESEQVRERREQLNQNFSNIDSLQKQARLTELRAQQLQKTISDVRNQRFVQSISKRSRGMTTAEFWSEFAGGFVGFGRGLNLLITDSGNVLVDRVSSEIRIQILLAILLILGALVYLRLTGYLSQQINRIEAAQTEDGQDHAAHGFLVYLRSGVLPGLLPFLIYRIFSGLGLLAPRMDQLLYTVVIALGFGIAAISLFRVYLAPIDGSRRLVILEDFAARRVFSILSLGLAISIALVVFERITVVLVSPIEVSLGLSLFFAAAIGGFCIWALVVTRAEYKKAVALGVSAPGVSYDGKRFWFYLIRLIWMVAFVILGAALTGYIAFAEFLGEQLILGIVVVLSTRLLLRFTDYSIQAFVPLAASSQEDPQGVGTALVGGSRQIFILFAGLVKMSIYLTAAILMLLPWGYRTSDFFQFFRNIFFGFEIGGLSFSISTVLLALALFAIGYLITIALRNWLNNKFLPSTNFDIGISNSISTVFGYIGFILAAIFAITAAGFDLSSLAIVAGALSVGVGFGLQSIVNNFVSGLILLAERPIKAGDWVETSGGQGYVKKISVRSTEIETFDRSTVIVPNSTLITEAVTNWTHDNKSGRIIIPVGVGYDSDPEQVREILLKCAKEQKQVLGRPEPVVYFMDFGASSLDFQLRCFLGDINYALSVSSAIRFEVLKELRAAGIEIPFPQRDVHIRSEPVADVAPAKRSK